MSFVVVSMCATSPKQPVEKQHRLELLTCEEKMAIITDVFLVALAATTATLIVLASRGVNLGQLSGIGALGMKTVYILGGFAGAVVLFDFIDYMVQMVNYISRLYEQNSQLSSDTHLHELEQKVEELAKEATKQKSKKTGLKLENAHLTEANKENVRKAQEEADNAALKLSQITETAAKEAKDKEEHAAQQIKAAREQVEQNKQEVARLTSALNTATKDADGALRGRVTELTEDKQKLMEALQKAGELDTLTQRLEAKQKELQEFYDTIYQPHCEEDTKLQDAINVKKHELARLEGTRKDHDDAIPQLKEKREKLEKTIEDLHQQAQKQTGELEVIAKNAHDEADKVVSRAKKEAEDISNQAREENEKVHKQIQENIRQTSEEAKTELTAKKEELAKVEEALKGYEEQQQKFEKVKKELADLEAAHADLKKNYDNKFLELQATRNLLDIAKKGYEDQKALLASIDASIEAGVKKAEDLKNKYDRLQGENKQAIEAAKKEAQEILGQAQLRADEMRAQVKKEVDAFRSEGVTEETATKLLKEYGEKFEQNEKLAEQNIALKRVAAEKEVEETLLRAQQAAEIVMQEAQERVKVEEEKLVALQEESRAHEEKVTQLNAERENREGKVQALLVEFESLTQAYEELEEKRKETEKVLGEAQTAHLAQRGTPVAPGVIAQSGGALSGDGVVSGDNGPEGLPRAFGNASDFGSLFGDTPLFGGLPPLVATPPGIIDDENFGLGASVFEGLRLRDFENLQTSPDKTSPRDETPPLGGSAPAALAGGIPVASAAGVAAAGAAGDPAPAATEEEGSSSSEDVSDDEGEDVSGSDSVEDDDLDVYAKDLLAKFSAAQDYAEETRLEFGENVPRLDVSELVELKSRLENPAFRSKVSGWVDYFKGHLEAKLDDQSEEYVKLLQKGVSESIEILNESLPAENIPTNQSFVAPGTEVLGDEPPNEILAYMTQLNKYVNEDPKGVEEPTRSQEKKARINIAFQALSLYLLKPIAESVAAARKAQEERKVSSGEHEVRVAEKELENLAEKNTADLEDAMAFKDSRGEYSLENLKLEWVKGSGGLFAFISPKQAHVENIIQPKKFKALIDLNVTIQKEYSEIVKLDDEQVKRARIEKFTEICKEMKDCLTLIAQKATLPELAIENFFK